MISEDKKQQILQACKIEDVIGHYYDLKKSGKSLYTKCPMCGKEGKGKGLIVTASKQIYKCFSCDFSGKSAVAFLMETKHIDFIEAMKMLSEITNIPLTEIPAIKKKKNKLTYCDTQLKASGLTHNDVNFFIKVDKNTEKEVKVFESGTKDQYGNIDYTGDDIIIWYYNLEGLPIKYKSKSGRMRELFRIRYQNPDANHDQHGNPMKYASPAGSGSHLYIPEKLRRMYQESRSFKRLYIQEGEKKAEKATKHGMPSVGIMGIHNIAYKGRLPQEFQMIVQRCNVEEIIFVVDADWKDLSNELSPTKPVDLRPRTFASAVINFRDYFKTFKNLGIFLECYFAAIKPNEKEDKGIDDLLANTMVKEEMRLREDFDYAINDGKEGQGTFVEVHRVSGLATAKIYEFWNLQSAEAFVEVNRDKLKDLPEFIINRNQWRFNKSGNLELSQPLDNDEMYWEQVLAFDRSGNEKSSYRFRYLYGYNFFRNRGYGRIKMLGNNYLFCHVQNKTVEIVEPYQIKDYAMEFTKEVVKKHEKVDVMDMLYRGGKMYFGPDSLGNLDFVNPVFEHAGKDYQNLYFANKIWKVSADSIKEFDYSALENYVWKDKIRNFDAKHIPGLIKLREITKEYLDENNAETAMYDHIGKLDLVFSEKAKKSHFIQFIWNTGEFYWNKKFKIQNNGKHKPLDVDERTIEEKFETTQHFLSKATAYGYLLHQYFDKSKSKAVIGMDGKLSEVGASNGGTGKSVVGDSLREVISQVAIGAKNKKLTEDPFLMEEVNEKTDSVFLDDVRANLDFEFLFPYITGKFLVNGKGEKKFTIPDHLTPKLYISTNHAINGEGTSYKRRQFYIAFSDFYNDKHVPIDDFGINFFDDWGFDQWNLFYNFMAFCLQLYFKHGLINPPMERLIQRRLRQKVGEDFLQWADEYYTFDELQNEFLNHNDVNVAIPRKELNDSFFERNPTQRKYVTPRIFKEKFKAYCKYRNARFNPHKFFDKEMTVSGADDKGGGKESFTLGDEKYSI